MTQKNQKNPLCAEELFRDAEQKEERRDYSGAFQSHFAGARLGNAMSQLALGNFYAAGRGVKKDLQEAARWYKRAYRAGMSAGAINLSVDLQRQHNVRGAITWLKRAAALNDGEAYLRLARIYSEKRSGTRRAIDLLKKAVSSSRSDIGDEAREQAEALLRKMSRLAP